MTTLVQAHELTLALTEATVIGPVDVSVCSGEVCVITGRARSGKSVLLGLLAGQYLPTSGSVDGPPANAPRAQHSLVPQSVVLVDGLTMGENILLSSRLGLSHKPPQPWIDEVVGELQIAHLLRRTPNEASYGECHRVMLARALCTQPSVLLVDEPFAHQDPEMCDSIIALLRHFVRSLDDTCCIVACRRYDPDLWDQPALLSL